MGTPISIQRKNGMSTPELRADEADADQVGRRAHRRREAADRGGERSHEHERRWRTAGRSGRRCRACCSAPRIDRPIANIIAVVAVLEIHAEMSAVARAEGEQDAARAWRRPREATTPRRRAAVEAVEEDRPGEDERADEEEHQRVGERREDVLRGRDAEHHARRRAEERGDRQRQRLRHPEDHHRREHAGEPVRLRGQRRASGARRARGRAPAPAWLRRSRVRVQRRRARSLVGCLVTGWV